MTTETKRSLTTQISSATDSAIVEAGRADLAVSWHSQWRVIGQVEQIAVNDRGKVVGTLVFNDDHVGRTAREMFETNLADPTLCHSALGVTVIYR